MSDSSQRKDENSSSPAPPAIFKTDTHKQEFTTRGMKILIPSALCPGALCLISKLAIALLRD